MQKAVSNSAARPGGRGYDALLTQSFDNRSAVTHIPTARSDYDGVSELHIHIPRCIRAEPDRARFVASQPNVTEWLWRRVRSGPPRGRFSGGSDGSLYAGCPGGAS